MKPASQPKIIFFDIEGGNTLRDAIDNDLAYIAQCYGIYDTDTDRLAATQDDW